LQTNKFSNFIGPYAGQNATNAGQSNFLVIKLVIDVTSANNSNLFVSLVLAQQMLVIQISLGLLLVDNKC
jgi:hypothetical protein